MFIRSLEDPLLVAVVNALDTLDNGYSTQGRRGDLPGRKLDDLFPRQHVGAKQFPHGPHAHAELAGD